MRPRLLSTVRYRPQTGWNTRVDVIDTRELSGGALAARIVRQARSYDALILDGSTGMGREPLAAALVRRRRRPPLLLILDATWKRGQSFADTLARRAALRLLDGPRVHYGVLSGDELRAFPANWGVEPQRVHFVPWYVALGPDDDLGSDAPDPAAVFAGGDSLRDYRPLLEAARQLPGLRLHIASRTLAPDAGRSAGGGGSDVQVGPVAHERFLALMRQAAVVVVALQPRTDRSAGQQTYLRAMAMGKTTIVSDVFGARDYIEDGRTGLLVAPGDARALREAIAWATDPVHATEARAIGQRAKSVLERFSPEAHVRRLLEVVEGALESERAQQLP